MDKKKKKEIETMVTRYPDAVMDALLDASFWPAALNSKDIYMRESDDTDGEDQHISISFTEDGDGWIEVRSKGNRHPAPAFHRFRTTFGGGRSIRTRTALLILARAMQLDQEERPDRPR